MVSDNLNIIDSEKKSLENLVQSLQNELESRKAELIRNREEFETHIKNYDRRLEEVAKETYALNESLIKIQVEKETITNYLDREREEKERLASIEQTLKVFLNF